MRPAFDYEPRETEGLISNEGEIKANAFLFDLRLFLFLFLFLFLLLYLVGPRWPKRVRMVISVASLKRVGAQRKTNALL